MRGALLRLSPTRTAPSPAGRTFLGTPGPALTLSSAGPGLFQFHETRLSPCSLPPTSDFDLDPIAGKSSSIKTARRFETGPSAALNQLGADLEFSWNRNLRDRYP